MSVLAAARYIRTQGKPWRETRRERKARFSRNSPRVDIILRERAELIDQLPVVVEARLVKGSPGLVIEQPRADTVTDLAPTTLLIGRARVINTQVIEIGLSALIDKRQRNRAVCSPERLLGAGSVVEGSRVLLCWFDAEDLKLKRFRFRYEAGAVKARLDVDAFVVIHEPAGSKDQLLFSESGSYRALIVEAGADIDKGFMKVALVLVDTRTGPRVVTQLLLILKGGVHTDVRTQRETERWNHALKPIAA